MRVLVAGSLGFIGGRLVEGLAREGHEVVGADRGEVAAALEAHRSEALVWAAGSRGVDPEAMLAQHVAAPLEALRGMSPSSRFVYLSSGEVYGPQAVPFSERAEVDPRSLYAQAKVAAEAALRDAAAEHGVILTVLRVAVVYGAGQRGGMFIPSLIEALSAGEPFAMTAGEQTRDFIYVDDVVGAVAAALRAAAGGLFNIGSGGETQLCALATLVARSLGEGAEELLRLGEVPYRSAEQMRYLLDPSAAQEALGFLPKVDLAEGIRRCIAEREGASRGRR